MNRQPLLIVLIAFIFGILGAEYLPMQIKGILVMEVLVIVLGWIVWWKKPFEFQKLKSVFLVLTFLLLGWTFHLMNKKINSYLEVLPSSDYLFRLQRKLNSNQENRKYEILILKDKSSPEVLNVKSIVGIPKQWVGLRFDQLYLARLKIFKIQETQQDFQFNYAQYLSRDGIFYQSKIEGDLYRSDKKMSFTDQIKQWRINVLEKIDASPMQPKTIDFTKGIILADRTDMDTDLIADFNRTGLMHFLAISGTHMVILFWLFLFFLRRILPSSHRNWSVIIALVFIWCFTVFIDYGSSVVRASVMITVYYTYVLLHRKPDLLHAMALAGLLLLFVNTNALFDVGFQLSFLAVLGIFWLNPAFLSVFPRPKTIMSKFFIQLFTISLSAQLATLPLVVYYFHQYSYLSLVANLIILPFSEIIILFSLLVTVLLALGLSIHTVLNIYDVLINTLLKVIHYFSQLDWAFQENIPLFAVEVLVLLLMLWMLPKVILKKNMKYSLWLSCVFIMFLGIRMGLNNYYYNLSEVISLNNFGRKIIVLKEKNTAHFFISENTNQKKLIKFIVYPYLSSRRISEFQIHTSPNNTNKVLINGVLYDLD